MKHTGKLKIIFEETNTEVKRKFDPSFLNSEFGLGLKYLTTKKNQVAKAFPNRVGIINTILSKDFKLFRDFQDMPWYLDLIAQRMIDEKGLYRIYIKGCRDYSFFDVSILGPRSKRRELLLSPFFHETPLPEKTEERELVRGLADTFLFLSPLLKEAMEKSHPKQGPEATDMITDAIEWFTIELETEEIRQIPMPRRGLSRQYELNVKASVDWNSSPLKKGKKSITIYNSAGKPNQIIVSSKNVREAIGKLSEAWHNPVSGSILLSAGSGAGKDVLQDILTYALSVSEVKTIALSAPHLGSQEKPLEGMFAALDNEGFITQKPPLKKGKTNNWYELNSALLLFLDEIHHDSAQRLREQLLRVLEAKEMTTGGKRVNFDKARYLFAASQPPKKLRGYSPPDFWTRIEYTVVMRHPLRLETRIEINETLQQYFCHFWRSAAEKRRAKTRDRSTINIIDFLCPETNDEERLSGLAIVFAETLDSPLIPSISIRHLRSIVNRLFSRAIYHLRTVKANESKKVGLNEARTRLINSRMDTDIIQIFNNIVPDTRADGVF